MPNLDAGSNTFRALQLQYAQLPWYKTLGFWFSAPRLAWGLFGYKQTPSPTRIGELLDLAQASWFFIRTDFELTLHKARNENNLATPLDSMPVGMSTLSNVEVNADVVRVITDFNPDFSHLNRHAAVSSIKAGYETRKKKITACLLQAVAYGMESASANTPIKPSDTGELFKSHLFANNLLARSPEYLLERGDVTDWAGRTFKNITAFEYALWAKDFKMIQMMLGRIPATPEGYAIRAGLLEQYKQVMAPVYAGGGLTYTITYQRPNLDAAGVPDGTTTAATEEHTENHFDLTPLIAAYEDYERQFTARTWAQRDACWVKIVGTLQRLLPVHLLQRYCDPDTPFYPLPQFKDKVFKRSAVFFNWITSATSSLFTSSLSGDFSLVRGGGRG